MILIIQIIDIHLYVEVLNGDRSVVEHLTADQKVAGSDPPLALRPLNECVTAR